MREKLFKFLFRNEFHRMEYLESNKRELEDKAWEEYNRPSDNFLLPLDFSNIDEEGKPPHYLKGLTDMERKNFIAGLESIYADQKLQTVFTYVINVIANYSFQKEPDETKMRNGRYAVIGVRTLMAELEKAHAEYRDSKKPTEEFDPLEILPEN